MTKHTHRPTTVRDAQRVADRAVKLAERAREAYELANELAEQALRHLAAVKAEAAR